MLLRYMRKPSLRRFASSGLLVFILAIFLLPVDSTRAAWALPDDAEPVVAKLHMFHHLQQTYTVPVEILNTGTDYWMVYTGYALRPKSVPPGWSVSWGAIGGDNKVHPGYTYTFYPTVTIPAGWSGTGVVSWQMDHSGTYFGAVQWLEITSAR